MDESPTDAERLARFVELVRRMRSAQTLYFKVGGGLDERKKIERAVDQWLREYAQWRAGQKEMF